MKRTIKILSLTLAIVMMVALIQIPKGKVYAKSDLPEASQKRLSSAIVLYLGSSEAYVNNVKTQVDPKNPEVCPITVKGRVLIPIRFISENLGAKVSWDSKTSKVTVIYKGKTVKMSLGSEKILIDKKESVIEVPAQSVNNRTYIPFRVLAEALGKKVFYDRGLIIISDKANIFDISKEKSVIDGIIAKVNNLPVVGSEAKLKELLAKTNTYPGSNTYKNDVQNMNGVVDEAISPNSSKSIGAVLNQTITSDIKSKDSSTAGDYSTTNVQVQGVDEADIVKTDGKYIYQINKQRVIVAEVYPADNMKIVSTLKLADKTFNPQEIYVDDKNLVVIGSTYKEIPLYKTQNNKQKSMLAYQHYSHNVAKAVIFDITDKTNIKQLREVEIDGNYVSSRKIGSALYLIANKYVYNYYIENGSDNPTPSYRDTAKSNDFKNVDYAQIRYFPGCVSSNYMVITGINLDDNNQEANVYSYLGAGQNIYASQDNLYVAVTNNSYYNTGLVMKSESIAMPSEQNNTLVYKFSLDKSKVTYLSQGEVPGTILNQFSMDENDGCFRIATTSGQIWRNDEYTSKNNVFILNDTLSVVGSLKDMAPGEKIYSVRFMGQKGYVVTYRQVDPLFVIDLTPESPKVLGKLKIPGYSDYLHPYDENHIIGFGKETEESKYGNQTLMRGMKIAIFDVTDVSNPKEMFKEVIGDRGTDSELLRNAKALLFSKEKSLLAFPVTVVERKARDLGELMTGNKSYEDIFQGAYVYKIDMEKGFTLKAKITHISDEEYAKAGAYWYGSDKNIERLLYIDDTLYTLSKSIFKAHDLNSMDEIKTLEIK